MATNTTNYNLVKPALTDAPPDITVMNPNWDTIDAKLKQALSGARESALPITSGGTGATTAAAARNALNVYSKEEVSSSFNYLKPLVVRAFSSGNTITSIDATTYDIYDVIEEGRDCFMVLDNEHILVLQYYNEDIAIFSKTSYSTNITVSITESSKTKRETVLTVASVNTAAVG